jgi:hypothetical protein
MPLQDGIASAILLGGCGSASALRCCGHCNKAGAQGGGRRKQYDSFSHRTQLLLSINVKEAISRGIHIRHDYGLGKMPSKIVLWRL